MLTNHKLGLKIVLGIGCYNIVIRLESVDSQRESKASQTCFCNDQSSNLENTFILLSQIELVLRAKLMIYFKPSGGLRC